MGNMKRIALFASGTGTNAEKIIEHCRENVALIVCNNPQAGVLGIAKRNNVPVLMINKKDFFQTENILAELKKNQIELIVLAGFLWLIPPYLIYDFPKKIINLHPALLPNYGGKGMYGMAVHRAVIDAGEKESGISIHYVNEKYDEGEIIFQARCQVEPGETPDTLAVKIHKLEHEHLPLIVKQLING